MNSKVLTGVFMSRIGSSGSPLIPSRVYVGNPRQTQAATPPEWWCPELLDPKDVIISIEATWRTQFNSIKHNILFLFSVPYTLLYQIIIKAYLAVNSSANTPTDKDDRSVRVSSLQVSNPGCDAGDHVTEVRARLCALAVQGCNLMHKERKLETSVQYFYFLVKLSRTLKLSHII